MSWPRGGPERSVLSVMKLLGVDFGTKRIGLAWSDTTLGVVLPFGVADNVPALAKLIGEEKIDTVVVGFPAGLRGEENKNTERVKKFTFELQKVISVPTVFFDERFSSQAADKAGGDVSRDERAAMIILEGYIQSLERS